MSISRAQRRFWHLSVGLVLVVRISLAVASNDSTWLLRAWQVSDGLPDDTVVGVAQTRDGFLWVATQGGLVRFDSLSFNEYPLATTIGQVRRTIETILLDRNDRLWMAESGGILVRVEGGQIKALFTTANGLLNLQAMNLVEDGGGALWIYYAGGRLVRFADGQGDEITGRDGRLANAIYRLTTDTSGHLWMASKNGQVGLFRDNKYQALTNSPPGEIRITRSRFGGIWICTDQTLYQCGENGNLVRLADLPLSPFNIKPTVVYEDHTGALWIGTGEAGLLRYAAAAFSWVATSHHEIWSVSEDSEGDIWVGTRGGGLNCLRPSSVEVIDAGAGVPNDAVQSLCQTANGDLWAVTRSGAVCRNQSSGWKTMWDSSMNASCVSAGQDGTLWVGTKELGLLARCPGTGTNLSHVVDLGSQFVRSLLTVPSGDVWIGTEGPKTLQRLRDGKLTVFPLPTNSESVCCMAWDAAGNFWAGTSGGLLLRVSHDRLINETPNTLAILQPIQTLATTPDGSLWIGYAGKGLGRLKGHHFTHVEMREGLCENDIAQIVPDGQGRIFLAGNRAICYLRETDFDDLAEGRQASLFPAVLNEKKPFLQTSRGYWPAALRTADANVLMPKANGLAVVHLALIHTNASASPVVLERVVVDEQAVAQYDPPAALDTDGGLPLGLTNLVLRLSPNHHQVRFELASLDFADPENQHFKFKLKGLDKAWVEAQARREAHYTRLSPGNYEFQAIACNANGIWSKAGAAAATLKIYVPPPFWQSWWFEISASLFVVALIAQMARLVEKRRLKLQIAKAEHERALERERTRIAKDIHDDLGAHLTEINFLSEVAQASDMSAQEAQADLKRIGAIARMLTISLSEIVWAVNPRNDTFESFATYCCDYAQEFLRRVGLRCRLELPPHLPHSVVTSELRHNLFLVVKEALTNISKHAHASEVHLGITLEPGGFRLVVKDNGKGIHPSPASLTAGKGQEQSRPVGRGNGLANMRERVENLGGVFRLSSSLSGTEIAVTIPCGLEND